MKKLLTLSVLLIAITAAAQKQQHYQKLGFYKIAPNGGNVWSATQPKVQSLKSFYAEIKKEKEHHPVSVWYHSPVQTKYKPGFTYRTIDIMYGSGVMKLISYKNHTWTAIFKMDAFDIQIEQLTEDIWIESDLYRVRHINDYTDSLNARNHPGNVIHQGVLIPGQTMKITVPVTIEKD